jgi:hypothetical protein
MYRSVIVAGDHKQRYILIAATPNEFRSFDFIALGVQDSAIRAGKPSEGIPLKHRFYGRLLGNSIVPEPHDLGANG